MVAEQRCGYGTRVRNQRVWKVVCRVLKHTSMVHNLSVYELQERLAAPERQEQQCMVDLEVFDSLQRQLHQLGKQAQMLNCVLNEQHFAQEALESELLEQMETFKNVHDSWTLVQDQIEEKRGWLFGETVIGSHPQQCQVELQHPFRLGHVCHQWQCGAPHDGD